MLSFRAKSRNLHSLVLSVVLAAPLHAQLVTPRTVPVFQDEQFSLFPTSRPGLNGLSIALDDTLADPFSNPAKTARLRGLLMVTSPYSHSITQNRGGGRTIPAGIMFGSDQWSGLLYGAMQEIDREGPIWSLPTSERTGSNQYLTATVARHFDNGINVGLGAFHADLSVVDGVDLLYPGSDRIAQSGSLTDVRLGATKTWNPGHVAELVLVRNTTHMRHDVHFTTWTWDPTRQTSVQSQRQDINLDETNIIGAHSTYVLPVGVEGWRIGVLATANRLDHPKIPNYVLQSIPRDPGSTNAFNIGVGAARETGVFTFATEVVLEPMASNTWADMTTNFTRPDGSIIPAGEKTMENHFTFRNGRAAIGGGRRFALDTATGANLTINFGLSARSTTYDLLQTNNMARTLRSQHEHWVEAGPSFGFRMQTRDFDFSYAYRTLCGTGCVEGDQVFVSPVADSGAPSTGGIIAAPNSPLFLSSGRESSHHFIITVPIR
jgi:hypothetical protein